MREVPGGRKNQQRDMEIQKAIHVLQPDDRSHSNLVSSYASGSTTVPFSET